MKKIILILIAVIMLCTAAIAESQSDTGNGIMERFVQREYQTIWENMADVMQGNLAPQADYAIIPSATHLLTQIDAPTGTQVDYKSGAHVCQEAIDTMAAWILHQAE